MKVAIIGSIKPTKSIAMELAIKCNIPIVVGQSELLPLDKFCKVCNLPTDGEKCYYKRCPV